MCNIPSVPSSLFPPLPEYILFSQGTGKLCVHFPIARTSWYLYHLPAWLLQYVGFPVLDQLTSELHSLSRSDLLPENLLRDTREQVRGWAEDAQEEPLWLGEKLAVAWLFLARLTLDSDLLCGVWLRLALQPGFLPMQPSTHHRPGFWTSQPSWVCSGPGPPRGYNNETEPGNIPSICSSLILSGSSSRFLNPERRKNKTEGTGTFTAWYRVYHFL